MLPHFGPVTSELQRETEAILCAFRVTINYQHTRTLRIRVRIEDKTKTVPWVWNKFMPELSICALMRYWKAPMVTLHSHPRLIAEHLFCMIDWEIWAVMQNTHWVTSAIATRILRLTHINLQEELYLHLGHSDARMRDGDQTASMNMFKQGQPWYHCPALIRLLRQCWLGVYPIRCIN